MKILYTNKYVEIKAVKEKRYLDIKQKQQIHDVKTLDRISEVIKNYTELTQYDSIVFTIGDMEHSFEYNLFQDQYFYDINQAGIKNLLLIIHDDENRKIFQNEIFNSNSNPGLNVEFFKEKSLALNWITNQPKEILAYQ